MTQERAGRCVSAAAALLLSAACGTQAEEAASAPEIRESELTEDPSASSDRLVPGEVPTTVEVPLPPNFQFEVTEPGEYQVDATGSPMDPELYLYRGDHLVEHDDDGGDGVHSRIIRFLEPGTYSVRVLEHRARRMVAQVSAKRLEPLEPVATLVLGEPATATIPEFPVVRRPRHNRDASRALSLEIAEAGTYTCDAVAQGRDAEIALIQDGRVLAEDDDGGNQENARIRLELSEGRYIVRVWDWLRRDATIVVTCQKT